MDPFVSRRRFLGTSMALGGAALFSSRAVAAGVSQQYVGLKSLRFLGKTRILAEIVDEKVFTEGPAWAGNGRLLFTNVPAAKILAWDIGTQSLSTFREESNLANGLYFDSSGRLLACEGGAGRVTRTEMNSGQLTVLADKYNNFPFAAPNDLCQDKQGRTYFTSRPGVEDPSTGNVNAVYRIDPGGKVTQLLSLIHI